MIAGQELDSYKSKAKAVTWEEYRSGGGGPSSGGQGPGLIGRLVRGWALHLIAKEKDRYEQAAVKTTDEFVSISAQKGALVRLFNAIKYDYSISGTVTACKTIVHFRFGCRSAAMS